jgi:hypothetical protein
MLNNEVKNFGVGYSKFIIRYLLPLFPYDSDNQGRPARRTLMEEAYKNVIPVIFRIHNTLIPCKLLTIR